MSSTPIFKLELDLHLFYEPPMSDSGPGVVLTRELELPFVPHEDLCIFSKHFDDCPDPMGLCIKDVVWDCDREVFLAHTSISHSLMPIAEIEGDIRGWIERGWRFGSLEDRYQVQYEDDEDATDSLEVALQPDESELMQTLPRRKRPREFNRIFKALIRLMAETFNNEPTAYAMDKLGWFREIRILDKHERRNATETAEETKWRDAVKEYLDMSTEEKFAWRDKVMRYRSFASVLRVSSPRRRKEKRRG